MDTVGIVREWHSDEGWGVIDSASTPGGCWAHFSSVRMTGYRTLHPGQHVSFDFEPAEQDGYAYRAVTVRTGDDHPEPPADQSPSAAYGSTLRLDVDPPDEPARM
ncbi:cold shock domain-containing protein [Asanoa sp. NPDC049518]|uniref:cold-shock protein n=1 Tax=unclassified Asanoa TaxID=2685164 RepID=UPI00341318C4